MVSEDMQGGMLQEKAMWIGGVDGGIEAAFGHTVNTNDTRILGKCNKVGR
jgi:hypothetical protein